ncbi:ACT domain-containing protein [Archaeoglobus profundus]|uniref:Amino acid-binding ACT domain protein n=1 Tax=Archaeoglobus profundus (strain DSM 5631 / JCM 9629 / NBRC 100127 / Av18) TaxID=572546 RepID=D2RGC0_ARCPA|nr:ACT domain-containing protein [Archaeoglobus profundus]ADB57345.1 amino acid-binding ACT domain protein [Archaeoglobus profundus DSM 5631]
MLTMVVELEDKPGQLIKVLEPISKLGGNIISVTHRRDEITPLGKIPVRIAVQIDEKKIDQLIREIESRGICIRNYNRVKHTVTTSLLLIGHIIHTDLRSTVDAVDRTGFAEVVEMRIVMPELNKPSTAFIKLSAVNDEKLRESVRILKEVCKAKGIKVVEPL